MQPERNGANRPADSVEIWELTGIYPDLDPIVRTLDHRVVRSERGPLSHVEVDWTSDMPPRVAKASVRDGCRLAPIGTHPGEATTDLPAGKEIPANFPRLADGGLLFPPPIPIQIQHEKYAGVLKIAHDDIYGVGTRTTAVVIRHKGVSHTSYRMMARENPADITDYMMGFDRRTPQRTWSVAKSIAATLVGAAVQRGDLAFNPEHYGFPDAPPVPVANPVDGVDYSLDLMLRMASGRYSDTPGNRTDALYFGGSTVRETALHWPLINEPGTVFRYANNDTLAAVMTISDTFERHPPAEFFEQVGMKGTVAETDWAGDYVLSSQVWATAEDLAKFGQLYLDDGMVDGKRILPEGWREYVSTPAGPQPDGPFGYGAGFWLLNKSEGVPPDTFAAFGNRGQYVVIVPSRDIVIVRRGEDPAGSRFDIAGFTRDVLAALEE